MARNRFSSASDITAFSKTFMDGHLGFEHLKKQIAGTLFVCILLLYPFKHSTAQSTGEPNNLLNRFNEIYPKIEQKILGTLQEINFTPSLHPGRTDPETGKWLAYSQHEWTSGFYSGILWQLYQLDGDRLWRDYAVQWTQDLEPQKLNQSDHDTGFRILPGFGLGFDLTNNRDYFRVTQQAAVTLASRYKPRIGAIKSWDWIGTNPVIVDNMMNIELLFKIGLDTDNQNLYNIALQHTRTTLEHHLRPDGSTYHMVDFDDDGTVLWKGTLQGYNETSTWARGQAWAIYGFTMAYRYTGDEDFLSAAINAASYFIANLPEDHVPFYDFRDPSIPKTTKDASAAAITASALIELYEFTENNIFLQAAESILMSLSHPPYFAPENGISSILARGARQKGVPETGLIYADYYYLEAWTRYLEMHGHAFPQLEEYYTGYLEQNYPNPYHDSTTILYTLEEESRVSIRIYDMSGRLVSILVDETKIPGNYVETFYTDNLASGTYLYQLRTNTGEISKLMTIIK